MERAGVPVFHLEAGVMDRVGLAIGVSVAIPRIAVSGVTRGAPRLVGGAVGLHLGARRLGLLARLGAGAARHIGGLAIRVPLATRDRRVVEAHRVAQLVELELRELARVADAQVVERQVRERHALELVDLVAQRLDHAVDLAVLPLVDRDAEPRVLGLAGQALDLGW